MRLFRHLLLLLGLVITQTVKAEKTAKAIWTEDNTTMTFVYDETTYNNTGDTYGGETITNVWVGNEVIGDDLEAYSSSGSTSYWRKWSSTVFSSLTKVVFAESFKDARPTSCAYWFFYCTSLSTIEGLSNLNTSQVTTMDYMFDGCAALTSLDVSGFDTGQVTNMSYMFYGCAALTSLDLSSFNTSNVTTMRSMFNVCSELTTLDVSRFNTSSVEEINAMFNGCSKLTTLDLSSFDTRKVKGSMRFMFKRCSGLTTLDLSSFNTGQVNEMKEMFNGCSNLTTIVVGDGWNTDAVTASEGSTDMFKDCNKLVGGKGTTFDSNKTDKTYAHIDDRPTNPGYLTDIADFFKLEITSAKMATLYYDQALKIPAGVNVYYCSGIDETQDYNVITHKITNAIPTETAVFLSGNKGHYLFSKTTDAVDRIEDNIMEGKTTDTTVAPREVLTLGRSNRTGIIGFNYYNGTTIPAYKAYIPADKVPANAPAISFFPIKYFEDEATSISILPEVSKVEDDAIYDLAGRKVKAATKGIFIKNGKKFIVK